MHFKTINDETKVEKVLKDGARAADLTALAVQRRNEVVWNFARLLCRLAALNSGVVRIEGVLEARDLAYPTFHLAQLVLFQLLRRVLKQDLTQVQINKNL